MIEILTFFYHSDEMEHINFLMTSWFDSMFLPSNIPALMKIDKVIHNIYCAPEDEEYLKENYVPMANKKGLDVTLIPIIAGRHSLHVAVKEQFRKSIQYDSKVILSQADFVLGNGLAKLVKDLKKGEYFVYPTLRINESALEKTKEFLKTKPNNKQFAKFFVEEIPHKLLELAKEVDNSYLRLKKVKKGWELRHKEPAPVICYPTEDMFEAWNNFAIGEFEVIDHELVELMFQRGRLKYVEDNSFVMGEFTKDERYNEENAILQDNHYYPESAKFFMDLIVKLETK